MGNKINIQIPLNSIDREILKKNVLGKRNWCSITPIGEDWGLEQYFYLATFDDGYKCLFEVTEERLRLILSEVQWKEYDLYSEEEWQDVLESILYWYLEHKEKG